MILEQFVAIHYVYLIHLMLKLKSNSLGVPTVYCKICNFMTEL